ncbi:hypothetical protein Cni_G27493 [Canna indica]|uniref:Uncharacterized protein n=1 Tax=Canna indica TaxID=4628 RepID=A0AAQ3QN06_9LILI|nr:hypothetical protein Cni_G27493 [Canna indica]
MEKNTSNNLLLLQILALLLLLLSCHVQPSAAVPAHRTSLLGLENKDPASLLQLEQDHQVISREVIRMMEEEISTMEIASNDYPGSGANNRHDPKSPGRP